MGSVEKSPPVSIAIIGSGIGGLTLAIGLLKQNVPFVIYEAAPRFDAVGAGIGMGPNALKCMELMDPKFAKMYDEIKVGNGSPEKKHEQFEVLGAEEGFGTKTGWMGGSIGHPKFTRSSAHRKALLEVMKSLIPEGAVRFNKRVVKLEQLESKKVRLEFLDGEVIEVDSVIGCDGIKGMTRRVVLESRYPEEVAAKYCHTYVYRGIAPMADAERILGHYALNAKWYMSKGRGWAMYPISKGTEANIVAFMHDEKDWEGEQAVREVTREEMLSEFVNFDHRLQEMLQWVKPAKWPLFNHPDTPAYYNGRICLLGDSAHASSPSQAAGAGMGVEDALILSRLLTLVETPDQLDVAYKIYDELRRPRAQGVVQESREVGDAYYLIHPKFGNDLQKITDEANKRLPLIWWHDLEGDANTAEERFKAMTAVPKTKKSSACISITPKPAPELSLPKSSSTATVQGLDTTLQLYVKATNFFNPVIPGHEIYNCPAMAFLVKNETTGKTILFDAGARKDYWNYSPVVAGRFEKGVNVKGLKIEKGVQEVLTDAGVDLNGLESVVWSHWHFDHIGDMSKFPDAVNIVVGPGFKKNLLPGYPSNPDSTLLETDYIGHEMVEIDFETGLKIGKFRAHDYFGDGSFYLLDVPGHAIGHMCGLARTTPTTFMLLGADTCHFAGTLRPSPYIPLPETLDSASEGLDAYFPPVCPCSMFTDCHPGHTEEEKRTTGYYTPSREPGSAYLDPDIATKSIDGMKEFDASDDVFVCLAHDPSLFEVLPLINTDNTNALNDWQVKGYKKMTKWRFLNELPKDGKPGREPLVLGLYRDGKAVDVADAMRKLAV